MKIYQFIFFRSIFRNFFLRFCFLFSLVSSETCQMFHQNQIKNKNSSTKFYNFFWKNLSIFLSTLKINILFWKYIFLTYFNLNILGIKKKKIHFWVRAYISLTRKSPKFTMFQFWLHFDQ